MDDENDQLRQGAALIREKFGGDPYLLSDKKFAELLAEAQYLKALDARIIKNSTLEALSVAFGNSQE